MHQRNRRLFMAAVTTSAIAVVGAVGTGVAGQGPARAATSTSGVAFTSTPATSAIVAHYTVTPGSRAGKGPGSSSNGDTQDQLPDLSPKHPSASHAASPSSAAAPNSDSTVQDAAGPGATPRTTASFIGMQGSNRTCSYFAHGCNPPDMAIAASPDFVFQGVNTSWEVLDPSGHVLSGWPVSAQRFFNVPNVFNADGSQCDPASGNQPFLSDPRALYDPADQRFWAAELQVEGAPNFNVAPGCPFKSVYFIAVSQTSDPRGNWNVYEFEMSGGFPMAADYTQFGLNGDAMFFSANMFGKDAGSPAFYAEIFEANKAQMERGRADFTADGFKNLQGTGPGTTTQTGPFLADTVQPVTPLGGDSGGRDRAQRQDGMPGSRDGLFVDTIDGPDLLNGNGCHSATDACKGLALWRMSDPIAHDRGGPAPTLTGTYLPTKPFYFPHPTDQPSCNACIDGNDLRIPAITFMRNGAIYAAWGTGINNGSQVVDAVEWAQVDLNDGENRPSTTTGYFTLSGVQSATYPALMPEANGDLFMVYEHFSSSIFPEARYTVRTAGQGNFSSPGRLLKAGEANYRPTLCGFPTEKGGIPVCRWGDYEATSFDGQGRIWMAGEYTNPNVDPTASPAFGRNWGTWIGAVGSDSSGG